MSTRPQFADDFGGEIAERLMNVDVRLPHEFSREVTQAQREQGRIDWKERNSANMEKMAKGEVTPIYQ
ncbi:MULTISPECIES: hypothetical protein [Gordonibacter]|uniref:Uncharacterized protein n=1 Tax=Gordonibacter faecis TaxID=3047475 RepID=A0ABT7DRB3_9ACTN|nr:MULTISPECIES: hypothetical protein [unclassified Gordonibacter]MDJ1651108.1 hypothetical protein [Gordonibacter sp. KGMB12511]HIW75411.1 hypothetical protein [Candidatus Gordonibacter avicola]